MRWLLVLFLALAPVTVIAQSAAEGQAYANRQLEDPELEAKAHALMFELRCVQCQGQSIGDSDAPIAGAMRHEVRERIKAGQSPDEVRAFFISRYGEYISFAPEAGGSGIILWLAPLVMLLVALFFAARLFTRKSE